MKKAVSLALGLFMVASLFTGCGNTKTASEATTKAGETTKETTAAQSKGLKGKITYMTHRTDMADTVIKDVSKEFIAKNPGVQIDIETFKDESSVKTRIAANEMPDIMIVPTQLGITRSTYNKYFVDISDLGFTKDNTWFYENGTGTDGKLYTLSCAVNYNGVIYNKNAFKTAGIDKAPTTLDEFYAVCEKLKAKGIVPVATNFKDKWPLTNFVEAYPGDASGVPSYKNLIATKDKYLDESTPGGILDGMKILKTLADKGYAEKDLMSTNWDGSKKDLAQGKVAMMYLGTWLPPQIVDNGAKPEDLGMFPFPGTKVLTLGADRYYGVTTSSKAPEAAKAFLKFMWTDSNMLPRIGFIPPSKSYKSDAPFMKELLSFSVKQLEQEADSPDYQTIINKAEIDNLVMAQEYVTSKDPKVVIEKYNKKWTDAKKAVGK